jgi:hypothetical protein
MTCRPTWEGMAGGGKWAPLKQIASAPAAFVATATRRSSANAPQRTSASEGGDECASAKGTPSAPTIILRQNRNASGE